MEKRSIAEDCAIVKLKPRSSFCVDQMVRELEALQLAGISVFSVAVSNRADEMEVRGISSAPQVANINYFLSPTITNLNSLSSPLATQVFCSIDTHTHMHSTTHRRNEGFAVKVLLVSL